MRRWVFPALAVVLGVGVGYLAVEGLYSLSRGGRARTSLLYDFYRRAVLARFAGPDPEGRWITEPSEFEAMIDLFKANGVGIGNSPFDELKQGSVAINTWDGDCKVQKPNLNKSIGFLRSNVFNPFDQVTFFYDADRQLPPELADFFDRYAFRQVRLTTNPYGERRTVPLVSSSAKVLVAGDSVAHGALLDDSETLASVLQSRDSTRQFINLGISGASTADIQCALQKAASRYRGQIGELIYVLCENDFREATPEDMVSWLVDFRGRESIAQVVLLYVPYIYNAVPEVTRIAGHSHYGYPTFREEKEEVLTRAAAAGFAIIDYTDVAREEARQGGSLFAPLALYQDQTHFSPPGVLRLLSYFDALRRRNSSAFSPNRG